MSNDSLDTFQADARSPMQAVSVGSPIPRPIDEAGRLAELERLLILDSPTETEYDDLVVLASEVCGTPIALMSLVDRDRQWFKAQVGLEATETPRELAFCAHAIADPDRLFTVPDATSDRRFAHNPLVTGAPNIRFYAGAPIVTSDGHALGTVCVIDTKPRTLTPSQERCLSALARQAAGLLALRRRSVESARIALEQAGMTIEARLKQQKGAELLDLVLQGRELGLWDLDVPSGRWSASDYEREVLGYADEPAPSNWIDFIHPEDVAATMTAHAAHLRGEAPFYECTHRIRHRDGHWIWVLGRGVVVQRDAAGRPVRIVGTHMDITERRRMEAERRQTRLALEHARNQLEQTAAIARVGGWEVDLVAKTVWWSHEVYRIHEAEASWVPELSTGIAFYAPEARPIITAAVEAAIADGTTWDLELPLDTARGRRIWVRSQGRAEYEGGQAVRLLGVFQDITERKLAELKCIESETLLRGITDNLPACIASIDREGRFRFANATYRSWIGIDPESMIGKSVADAIGREYYESRRDPIERALAGEAVTFEQTTRLEIGERTLRSTYLPHFDAQRRVAGFYALTDDITELKETQRKLDALARADTLTGLPNRRHFDERISEALARARRARRKGALFYLDVDRFKSVNDTLGHAAGDELLQHFATRVSSVMRETDFVARYAGDEFLVIAEGVVDDVEARVLAEKIAAVIRRPFALANVCLNVTTSIGIATFEGTENLRTLLARADAALYVAKAAGRDGIRLGADADPETGSAVAAR